MNRYIWSAVGVVVLAFALMELVRQFLPVVIVMAAVYSLYSFLFRRRW